MVDEILDAPQLPAEVDQGEREQLPPVIHGHQSPAVVAKVESFYSSVAAMFEAWVNCSGNYHTRRCYRRDVIAFI